MKERRRIGIKERKVGRREEAWRGRREGSEG